MFTDDDCARFFASEESKNLRALAIKAVAKCDIRRDRLRPPIAFDVPIFSNIAHGIKNTVALSRKVSRCIKFRVNAAAGQKFGAAALFDDASVL